MDLREGPCVSPVGTQVDSVCLERAYVPGGLNVLQVNCVCVCHVLGKLC